MPITELPKLRQSKTPNFEKELGQMAALFLILFSAWKFLIFGSSIEPLHRVILSVILVGLPLSYLYGLRRCRIIIARVFLQIWAVCVLVLSFSGLDIILADFAFFFKFIVPAAALYWCMVVGVGGIEREEEDDLFTKHSSVKNMGILHDAESAICSLAIVITGTAIFTLDVCIAKYIHDLFILNWSAFTDYWFWLFIGGLLAGYIPAHFVGCALGGVFQLLSARIYRRTKRNDNKESL